MASWYTTAQTDALVAAAKQRINHIGTQSAATITGLATVATSGNYNDLTNKPTGVGTVADATATTNGVIRLAGALAGTAASPQLTATGVSAGTYGGTTQVPVLTIAADGRISAVSLATVAAGTSSGGGSNIVFTDNGDGSVTIDTPVGVTPVFVDNGDGSVSVPTGGGGVALQSVADNGTGTITMVTA